MDLVDILSIIIKIIAEESWYSIVSEGGGVVNFELFVSEFGAHFLLDTFFFIVW